MKKILLFFLVISSSALAGSMLGLDALGKEDVAGATAAIAGEVLLVEQKLVMVFL